MKTPWKQFWFESNRYFDFVKNYDDWIKLRTAYPELTDEQLLNAREATYNGTRDVALREKRPNYGFRIEHDGDKRLKDFFAANEMTLPEN